MPFKVNYGFQKAERDRAKKAKKEAKAREREAARTTNPEPGQEQAETTEKPGDPETTET